MRLTVLAFAVGLVLAAPAGAVAQSPSVVRLDLEGTVDPFNAAYLESGIEAAQDNASAVLITIDTPGGSDTAMRRIIRAILDSEVPVLCYIAPEGARGASAGTFVLMACPVAAMAPGTNVGAAHPVGVSGAIESEKVTNDAAAYLRSLAEDRGRNADWAERAVRESDSISARQALDMDVIDLLARSTPALLEEVDGRTVRVAGGRDVTLATAGAEVVDRQPGLAARILSPLFSPNLAFLFFYLGLALVVVEILNPGVSVPGLLGAACLAVALVAFGMLPIQLLGVGLVLLSVGFFLLEFQFPGLGIPTAAGVISMVAGGLLLFDRSVPDVQVSFGIIGPVAAGSALFFGLVVKAALAARRMPPAVKSQNVVGAIGQAVTDLAPEGVVQVVSESWTASSATPVAKGQKVRVLEVDGLRLKVEPAVGASDGAATPSPSAQQIEHKGEEG
ncbi:MAG TPA: nodulation protein NfeD [Actinomycetota bacterium]|nr:nodulation protein NfeD [Actinomycetota bacterium]